MRKRSKRYKKIAEQIDKSKVYELKEALTLLKENVHTKFDETFELNLALNVDPKKSEQMVRGTATLPNGTGKKVKVAAFCKGEAIKEAQEAGADYVGAEELVAKVAGGFLDFDKAVSTPDMMKELAKLGKVLGPRGLMPSPKTGTVTTDIAQAIKAVKAGRIEFKVDKQGGLHIPFGRASFDVDKLWENLSVVVEMVKGSRPPTLKGQFIKRACLCTTMSPGLKVDFQS